MIAIVLILAGTLASVYASAKEASKRTSCLSNIDEINLATTLYLQDYDGIYPATRKPSYDPAADDAAGQLEEPDYGPLLPRLAPYRGNESAYCPSDPDPKGLRCDAVNFDHPELNSYLYNGFFAFGLSESQVRNPASTVLFAERRSETIDGVAPFCNYLYRPWFNSKNPTAPEDDMHPKYGAISSRHSGVANYTFADGHTKAMHLEQTLDMHTP